MKYVLLLLLCLPSVAALNATGEMTLSLLPDANCSVSYALTYPGGEVVNVTSEPFGNLFNVSIPYELPNATNLTYALSPNVSQTFSGFYDQLNVSCAAANCIVANCSNQTVYVNQSCTQNVTVQNVSVYNVTGGFCNRTYYVDAGQSNNLTDNGCYLNIIGGTTYSSNNSYGITAPIRVTQDGYVFTVSGENDSRTFDTRAFNGSASFSLNYTCPIIPVNSDLAAEQVLNYCNAMSPYYLTWFNTSLGKCLDQYNSFVAVGNTKDAQVSVANQVVSDLKAENANLSASLAGAQSQNMGLVQVIAQKDDSIANFEIGTVLLIIIVLGSLIVNILQWVHGSED